MSKYIFIINCCRKLEHLRQPDEPFFERLMVKNFKLYKDEFEHRMKN
jgi:hypothetical protein